MPYADASQYVLASEAIPEIARCYFGGDTSKAESDAQIAAQEGELPVFRDTPFLHINRERWYHDHIHWSSIFDPLYFPRADLLKIYPDLWRSLQSPDNETTLIAVTAEAPQRSVDEDSQPDDEAPETQRDKRKRETEEKHRHWLEVALEIKAKGKCTGPTAIASAVAKRENAHMEEKGKEGKRVYGPTVHRRLNDLQPGWAE